MRDVVFSVPGEPVGKGRPRFVRQTGRTYTPEKTANYENLVKLAYGAAAGGWTYPDSAELAIRIEVYFEIPKSKSKRAQHDMELGIIRATKKPDADNILKIIADALNHIAYRDDAQIVYAEVSKKYARTPRTDVHLWEL